MSPIGEAEAIRGPGVAPASGASPPRLVDLHACKSLALELAYEEYCLRREQGEQIDSAAYADRFPGLRSSVRRLTALHDYFQARPDLLPPAEPNWPKAGDVVGSFVLRRQLGRGAFARVFLAADQATGDRPVVVKLSFQGAATEAHLLGPLQHPAVVPVLSAGVDEATGLTVLCMPFKGCATLLDVLDRAYADPATRPRTAEVVRASATLQPGDPPVDEPPARNSSHGGYVSAVLKIGQDLAEALAFLHDRGVYHRDLKPSNVLLTPAGRPLLLDFNLSDDHRRAVERFGGTLPYMAPEQIRLLLKEPGVERLDARADLYSLAVVLYELLTGVRPFAEAGADFDDVDAAGPPLLARQRLGCRPIRSLNPDVDRESAHWIERCLSFDRDNRPRNASELAKVFAKKTRRPTRTLFALAATFVAAATAFAVVGDGRPPADRSYVQGKAALRAGDVSAARERFAAALALDGAHRRSRIALASAFLADGDASAALGCYTAALAARTDGPTLASVAYCFSLRGDHRSALLYADDALQAGFRTPELLNNKAFSLLAVGEDLKEVSALLDEARRLDPDLPAARYNAAMLALQRRFALNGGPFITEDNLRDLDRAVDDSPTNGVVCYDAAQVYAAALADGHFAGQRQPEAATRLRTLAVSAMENGIARRQILGNHLIARVLASFELPRPEHVRRSPSVATANPRLACPVPYLSD
jgi:serine/threonine protein kinase